MFDPEMTVKNKVGFPDVKSTGSTVDADSAAAQAVLNVAATTNFNATDYAKGWRVIIGRGTAREEEGTVLSIQAGISITLDANLTYAHTAVQADVVEVLWAGLSEVIVKKHYKRLALFLGANWLTAKITFLGCLIKDGTYLEIDSGIAGAELTVADAEASKAIGLDGILMESLEAVPYLKLRSGVEGTEVDQYNHANVNYVLMR